MRPLPPWLTTAAQHRLLIRDGLLAVREWEAEAGDDPASYVADRLHRAGAYPLGADRATWNEGDLFATVELAIELASAPTTAEEHEGCGWHGDSSGPPAKDQLREEFNAFLIDYGPGHRVTETAPSSLAEPAAPAGMVAPGSHQVVRDPNLPAVTPWR